MPAILAHDIFGRSALEHLPAEADVSKNALREAFLLGNQGPDPLFYLPEEILTDAYRHLGRTMHHLRPALLISNLHDAIGMLAAQDEAVGKAYALGFLCHWLLDSQEHPFILAQVHEICSAGVEGLDERHESYVHAEIERDLDEAALYSRTGHTIKDERPYRSVLKASDQTLAVIDRMYFYLALWTYSLTLDVPVYSRAVRRYRQAMRLFWSPRQLQSRCVGAFERLVRRSDYSMARAMSHRVRAEKDSDFANDAHRVWVDPGTGERRTDGFWDIFEGAEDRCSLVMEEFLDPSFDLRAAESLTGDRNFSGEVSASDDPLPDEPPSTLRERLSQLT